MISELDQFKTQGFFVARGLLDRECIEKVRHSLAKTFSDQLPETSIDSEGIDHFDLMLTLFQKHPDRYKKIAGALWRKLDVYQILHEPRIIKFLQEKFFWRDIFVPGGQVVHIMATELRIPDGYFGLSPHQDFPSVQGSLDGVIVWLPLVNVDRNNFPLELIPASHRQGILPVDDQGPSAWEVRSDQYQEEDVTPVEVDVGDVVFMSMFTVHRSSVNGTTGLVRIAVSTRFDNADEDTFIERCYPSAYVRDVHRDQYFQNFPTMGQVEKVFQIDKN